MPNGPRIPATIYYAGGGQAHVYSKAEEWIATCEVRGWDGEANEFAEPEPSDDAIRFRVGQCLALDQVPRLDVARVVHAEWDQLGEPSPGPS